VTWIDGVDRAFLRVRESRFLYRFALFTRILLAAGFIPTGMVKLVGERFTFGVSADPIGAFFEAMYQIGLYWRFLGLSQVLAGALVLVPRWAHLGAAMFLPIMANIFVVTVALRFRGTPLITGLMLLAVVYLCAWDYHRFRGLITEAPPLPPVAGHRLDTLERICCTLFAAALLVVGLATRDLAPRRLVLAAIFVGAAAGLTALGRFA
jgi:hypothetical protein